MKLFRKRTHTHTWGDPYLGMFGGLWHECTTCGKVGPYHPMATDV